MKDNLAREAEGNPLEKSTSYQIENKTFVVEPVFAKDGRESLGSILLRLMRSEIAEPR